MLSTTPPKPHDGQQRRFATLPIFNAFVAAVVILRCAWLFSELLRSRQLPLGLAEDDFYYYLLPAQNLAWHGHPTFFENVATNGYHPLYFLLLAAASVFIKTLPGIFRFLWVLDTVSAAAVFLLSRRVFAKVSGELLSNALAIVMTALCFTQICDQMEVTLALPLGFAFLLSAFVPPRELTARRTAAMGILGALTMLARLDAGLLIAFYALGIFCVRAYRRELKMANVSAFLAAFLPLPLVYVAVNHHFFGTLLPISGMAKELRRGHVPSLLLPGSFSGTTEALVNAAVLTIIFGLALRAYLTARERVLLFATLATPFVFYGLEMLISDWPVWNWYFYVLRFSALAFCLLIAIVATRTVIPSRYPRLSAFVHSQLFAGVLAALALAKLFAANYKVDVWMTEIQHAAGILDAFAASHPGVYAMGDRAGMFAITTPNPVLQTEGLVMDKKYLAHIRRQDDLRSTLAEYGVNYYVAFVFKRNDFNQFKDGCFIGVEPSIAGPDSLRMHSTFCEAPVFEFSGFDGRYLIYRIRPV